MERAQIEETKYVYSLIKINHYFDLDTETWFKDVNQEDYLQVFNDPEKLIKYLEKAMNEINQQYRNQNVNYDFWSALEILTTTGRTKVTLTYQDNEKRFLFVAKKLEVINQ